jgi:C-terminal processing protease CtpA/Prc
MKKILLVLGLLSSLAACNKNAPIQSRRDLKSGKFITDNSNHCLTNDCQMLRKEFDYIVYTGKKIYCYWDLKKESTKNDFDQIGKELKLSITDSTSMYEYYLILRKWAGSFQDGHVNAIWGTSNENLEEMAIPVKLELLAPGTDHETLIIASNSPETKNFPVGAVVTQINDTDAMNRLNSIEKYMSGSTSRMRRSQAARLLFSIMDSRKEEKSAVKIQFVFNNKTITDYAPRLVTLPLEEKEDEKADDVIDFSTIVQVQVLPNNIGYLRINSFVGGTKMSKLLERSMKILDETSALIIDVRKNGGGDQSGNAILAHLIEKKIARYHHRMRISDLVLLQREEDFIAVDYNENDIFTPYVERSVEAQAPMYKGKVYVLTSPKCFSACDTFVSAMKENNLATIVGEGTGGGTGTPYVFELNYSGLSFRYSVTQGITAVHKQFLEGTGTLPDIEIFPTIEERIKGEDLQLLNTINLVAKKNGQDSIEPKIIDSLVSKSSHKDTDAYTLIEENRELKKSKLIDKL